jgi:hypothetical protein
MICVRPKLAQAIATLVLSTGVPLAAHGEIRLATVLAPRPGVVAPPDRAPGGWADFRVGDDGRIEWELTVENLSGTAREVSVRVGAEGARGRVVATLTNPPASGTHIGRIPTLAAGDHELLIDEGLHVEVATAANPGGEVSGTLRLSVRRDGRTCYCAGSTTRAFRRCVRDAIKAQPRDLRRAESIAHLRAVVRAADCGAPRRRRATACCLGRVPYENLVLERLCGVTGERRCERLDGEPAPGAADCDAAAACQ